MSGFDPGFDVPLTDQEMSHLLGRSKVDLEIPGSVSRRVLITGAGGSVGRDLTLRLTTRGHQVVALDRSEKNLFFLQQLSQEKGRVAPEEFLLVDLSDRGRVREILAAGQFDTLIHTAAHKHVGMMEFSAEECRRNNVEYSLNLFQDSREAGVPQFVFLTTDKAIEATSVMGRTKAEAENLLRRESSLKDGTLVIVRLPNVLGSDGSVAQIFRRQVLLNRPLTLTHKDAERLFVSPQEACDVIEIALAQNQPATLVPTFCVALRIETLARRAQSLWGGLRPMKLELVGLARGERLRETLFDPQETGNEGAIVGVKIVTSRSDESNGN